MTEASQAPACQLSAVHNTTRGLAAFPRVTTRVTTAAAAAAAANGCPVPATTAAHTPCSSGCHKRTNGASTASAGSRTRPSHGLCTSVALGTRRMWHAVSGTPALAQPLLALACCGPAFMLMLNHAILPTCLLFVASLELEYIVRTVAWPAHVLSPPLSAYCRALAPAAACQSRP